MGAWRRLHTRAEEGRLLIVSTSGVLERPRGLVLSVPLPDRVWVTGIGGRLPLRLSRRLSTVTTPSARLLRFEGEAQNCSRRIFAAHTLQTVVNRLSQDHRLAAPTRRAKKLRFAAHRQCKHSIFLQQLQPSCSVPGLRTRVPQRFHYDADNPTKLSHDDARRAPHVQRDEAAHASRSA